MYAGPDLQQRYLADPPRSASDSLAPATQAVLGLPASADAASAVADAAQAIEQVNTIIEEMSAIASTVAVTVEEQHQAVAVIALAGFAVSLLFPAIRIAPKGSTTDEALPPPTG